MNLRCRWIANMTDIPPSAWDELAQPLAFPFLEWDWLATLEQTGCVGDKTGWLPCHLTYWRGDDLIAAAALYIKTHSWGEFVFDQMWAQAAMACGRPYYPKLIGMSPFTPVPGYRFLIAPGEDRHAIQNAMLQEIDTFCQANQLGGFHLLHIEPEWQQELADSGLHPWHHYGLVWRNRDFTDFDDYLAQFRSHRRKTIRRERRKITDKQIQFRIAEGDAITLSQMETMFAFYASTCIKYWGGSRYLNLETFRMLKRQFGHRLVLMSAHLPSNEDPVAMSLLLRKGAHLYGRYWGCNKEVDGLHFETCYYQPIQWAIEQGMQSYDAGSGGGQHKHRRGFPAETKYSLHRLYDSKVDQIWRRHLDRVNRETQRAIDELNEPT